MERADNHEMKELSNPFDWDRFEDRQKIGQFQSEGIIELQRKYIKNDRDEKFYLYHPELDPIVAKGISAFLAYPNYQGEASFLTLINSGKIIDLKRIYSQYFDTCLKFLSDIENRKPFKEDKKSDEELIRLHLRREEMYFEESKKLFEEVTSREATNIEIVKKAALMYSGWVKENKITKDVSHEGPVSKPTIPQIALKYVFEDRTITRINADQIARENGHMSGEKLYQEFTLYTNKNDRKARPTNSSKTTLGNKIRLFEIVIEMLPESKKQRAQDELKILKDFYAIDYQ